MAKSLKTDKSKGGGGIDPELWESAPAQAVGNVSNQSIVSMTGGDAGTYEGIVDYILMGEERDAPGESEIVASENAGLLERNYPDEVETEASLEPSPRMVGPAVSESTAPTFASPGGDVEMDGLGGGDMGMEGMEAGADQGSQVAASNAKVAFGSASVPTGISGGMDGGMIVAHKGDDAKVFKAIGGPDPSQLSAQNAAVLGGMQGMVEGLGSQVDSTVSTALGSYGGAHNNNVSSLDGAFGANLSLIQGSFVSARSQVTAAAVETKGRVETASMDAVAQIDSLSRSVLAGGIATIEGAASAIRSQAANTESQAMAAVGQAQGQAQTIAKKWADAAKAKGKEKADGYRGRGNSGTEGKRDEARAQVADAYGEGYSEDLPNVGQQAVEALEQEKSGIRNAIRELTRSTLETDLPALQANLVQEVTRAANEARDGVQSGRDEALEAIDTHHTTASEELASSESAAIGDLVTVYGTASGDLETSHAAGEASITAMGEGLRSHLVEKAAQLRSLIANNPALPLADLQQEVASLAVELTTEAGAANQAIGDTAKALQEEETSMTMDAVQSMGQIGQAASEGALGLAGQAVADLDTLGTDFETGIDQMLQGYTTNLMALKTQVDTTVAGILTSVLGGLSDTLEGVRTGIGDFMTGFDTELGNAVNVEMVQAIEQKAEEEASKIKEPSLWDKVCSVVKVVLVVVAIVAITVFTAGVGTAFLGASLGMTMLAGALMGAVAGALSEIVVQIATKGVDPRNWDWGKIGIEALVGGVVGGLTAGLGVGLKALGTWGMKVKAGTTVVRNPALQRIGTMSATLMKNADDLSLVGRIAEQTGGSLIGDAATWAKTGKRPTLADVGKNIVLKSVTNEYAQGMKDLLPSSDPQHLKDGFAAYMQFLSEEAATGAKTEEILERVDAPVADLGNLDLTTDYKPVWTPTW